TSGHMSTFRVAALAGTRRRNQCSQACSGEPSSGHPNHPWYPNISLRSSVVASTTLAAGPVAGVGPTLRALIDGSAGTLRQLVTVQHASPRQTITRAGRWTVRASEGKSQAELQLSLSTAGDDPAEIHVGETADGFTELRGIQDVLGLDPEFDR